jgi:dTDP-4-amino-4,6-dideoxygalactose transaminase
MANVTRLVGAMPVFCDIVGPHQPVACPRHAESLITPRTRALVVMAYGGMPPDMAAWSQLAHRHGLALIEDACHGLGAQWCGRNLGLFGHVAAFSFFANKNLVTGEGGMAVTGDAQLAARLRLLRSHGMSSLTHERHHRLASTYDVTLHGMNVRLDEIRAALGRVQLRKLAAGNARRSDRLREYAVALESGPVTLPDAWSLESLCGNQRHGCHLMPVLVPPQAFWIDLARHLNHQGIQTSHHYPPVHQFTAFAPASAAVPFLPCTDDFAARQVTLPLWAGLTSDEVLQVASAVKAWPSA